MLTSITGCKEKGSSQYKYDAPYDLPCIAACNAININDANALRKQLEKGVDPNLKFLDGSSLLYNAVGLGAIECTRTLIEHGADVNIQSKEGTPLHMVTRHIRGNQEDQKEILQILLEAGANVTLKDADGFTALDNARANDFTEIASIIEKHMTALGLKIEESMTEISAVPGVSILKVKGNASMSYSTFSKDGRFLGRNVTILGALDSIPTISSGWIMEIENLPEDKYWIEVKTGPLTYKQNWPILKEAFEKTFKLKFVTENRLIDMYALEINPDKEITLENSPNDGDFDWEYTSKGFYLKNCRIDDLCGFLGEKLESEVINQTNLQGTFDLYLDYDESLFEKNLFSYGLLLIEIKKEREALVVKKAHPQKKQSDQFNKK